MSSVSPLMIRKSDEHHPPIPSSPSSSSSFSSASSASSSSSSSSSPTRHVRGYLQLHDKPHRKKRSFIPESKKDPIYWSQRSKNNLSAQRSRVKRRMNDLVLETKLTQLSNENQVLKAKIDMLARKFGHLTNDEEQVDSTSSNLVEENDSLLIVQPAKNSCSSSQAAPPVPSPHEEQSLLHPSSEPPVSSMCLKWRFKLFNSSSSSNA